MAPTAGKLVTEAQGYDEGRLVTVYVPPERADAVVFAADGGWHVSHLSEVLENTGARSTMIVGVHGQPDDDGRLHEYVPGFDVEQFARHERFFVDEVRQWVASRFDVAFPVARTAVWGASLGGEFALAMGLRHADVFGVVMAASPGAGFQPPEHVQVALPRFYLVAGRQEPFFLDNAKRWADALRTADADVVMMQRDGAHGGAFWGEEFPPMVKWAFGH